MNAREPYQPAHAGQCTDAAAPARKQQVSKIARLGWSVAASVVLGIILCLTAAPDGREAGNSPDVPVMIIGVLLIVLPLLAGAIAVAGLIGRELARDVRKEQAWKKTLTPQQQLGVKAAETAALYAAWAGVHHWVKEGKAKSAALYQERQAASQDRVEKFYGSQQ